jgi:hypothetical protein
VETTDRLKQYIEGKTAYYSIASLAQWGCGGSKAKEARLPTW